MPTSPRRTRVTAPSDKPGTKKRPAHSLTVRGALEEADAAVRRGEVVILVLGPSGALMERPRLDEPRPGLRTLETIMLGARVAAESLRDQSRLYPLPLSNDELHLLDSVGFVEAPEGANAIHRSTIELELLLRESASLEDAAAELGVTTGRLRQRLSENVRSLYGIKEGRVWRLPRFQFAKKGRLVRNIGLVLPHVSPDAHPLAVRAWFTMPHQDLVVGEDETAVTPLAWLEAGWDADVVAELAAEI